MAKKGAAEPEELAQSQGAVVEVPVDGPAVLERETPEVQHSSVLNQQ